MYADDLVLLAESEHDLQILLNALNAWCNTWDMSINVTKSQVVHFRRPSVPKTKAIFKCGDRVLDVVESYTYLGMLIDEFLDYERTAKSVAKSASRALGLLIAKCKIIGGLPFNVFTKLYDNIVVPVISYSVCIWGFKPYSCISAIQNRAMRFYLGVGKYTPNAALSGEMGWVPMCVRQYTSISNFLVRISCTQSSRLNKRIALWAFGNAMSCKNWFYNFRQIISDLNINVHLELSNPMSEQFINTVAYLHLLTLISQND